MSLDVSIDSSTNHIVEEQEVQVVVEEEPSRSSVGKYVGQCKWFNDMLGFGFVTVCEGPEKGKDIFAHWSGIKPLNSNYRTLKKGEYLNFNIIQGMNGLQAVDVTGINGGPLMCDFVSVTRTHGGIGVETPALTANMRRTMRPPQPPNVVENMSSTQRHPSPPQASNQSTQTSQTQSTTPSQWHVVTKTGRRKNLAKYSKEGRLAMKQAKQEGRS